VETFRHLGELAVGEILRRVFFTKFADTIGISVGVASLVCDAFSGPSGLQQLASRRLMKSGFIRTVVVTSRRDLRNFRT